MSDLTEFFGESIHAYTRARALADDVLVDVSAMAREAGIRFPTAVTRAVWDSYVRVPPGVLCQDEPGRLWDICGMLRCAIGQATGDTVRLQLHVRCDNHGRRPPLITLKAVCGPGDQGEPVITVMVPEED